MQWCTRLRERERESNICGGDRGGTDIIFGTLTTDHEMKQQWFHNTTNVMLRQRLTTYCIIFENIQHIISDGRQAINACKVPALHTMGYMWPPKPVCCLHSTYILRSGSPSGGVHVVLRLNESPFSGHACRHLISYMHVWSMRLFANNQAENFLFFSFLFWEHLKVFTSSLPQVVGLHVRFKKKKEKIGLHVRLC